MRTREQKCDVFCEDTSCNVVDSQAFVQINIFQYIPCDGCPWTDQGSLYDLHVIPCVSAELVCRKMARGCLCCLRGFYVNKVVLPTSSCSLTYAPPLEPKCRSNRRAASLLNPCSKEGLKKVKWNRVCIGCMSLTWDLCHF